jgi:hypothetical protein
MKLPMKILPATVFQKVEPFSRLFWVGLICCFPAMIGAQEINRERVSANTNQNGFAQEIKLQSNEAAEAVDSTPVAAQGSVAESDDSAASLAAQPAPLSKPTASKPAPAAPKATTDHKVKSKEAPPLCRPFYSEGAAPLRPIATSTVGVAPLHNGNFVVEFLYWEGVEESLRYAMKNWTAVTPSSPIVNQKLHYSPGARASIYAPLCFDEWEVGLVYTYFYSTPPTTHVEDPEGDLLASLNFALISSAVEQPAYSATGRWNLKMNVLDLELVRPFVISQSLMLQPLMGGKACFVRQKIDVHYDYLYDHPNYFNQGYEPETDASNARHIRAHSSVWAVGPEFGCEMRFLIPKHISLSIKGAFSALLGNFSGSTSYSDYKGLTTEALITENKTAMFEVGQLQCALSKWWRIKSESSLELTLGWESQIWWGQMRMNWWSTIVLPPQGSTLTVKGPFFKAACSF